MAALSERMHSSASTRGGSSAEMAAEERVPPMWISSRSSALSGASTCDGSGGARTMGIISSAHLVRVRVRARVRARVRVRVVGEGEGGG
jgi:hypothetical protein